MQLDAKAHLTFMPKRVSIQLHWQKAKRGKRFLPYVFHLKNQWSHLVPSPSGQTKRIQVLLYLLSENSFADDQNLDLPEIPQTRAAVSMVEVE